MKKNALILIMLSLFPISNAQFFDADLDAIERVQNQQYNEQQRAKKATAARQAKINADRAAKQAKIDADRAAKQEKIDAREERNYIKLDNRDDEIYELEMEIKRMELMARKKQLDRDAKRDDIELMREEAKADREVALERSRSKRIDEFTDAELENERTKLKNSKDSDVFESIDKDDGKKSFFSFGK